MLENKSRVVSLDDRMKFMPDHVQFANERSDRVVLLGLLNVFREAIEVSVERDSLGSAAISLRQGIDVDLDLRPAHVHLVEGQFIAILLSRFLPLLGFPSDAE